MKANPYHPDWRAYACGQARGVGADVVDGSSGVKGGATPTWTGSGPTSGVLGMEPGALSTKSVQNYYPSTKTGSIEFVFDTTTQTFAVGRPTDFRPMMFPHQQLADSIKAADSSVVGGMFRRGPNGEFITNEFSGHYWQNWTPATRNLFEQTMSKYGIKIEHRPGME